MKPDVLENYGTVIDSARLSPSAVLQAAAEDFKRQERNQLRRNGTYQELDYEQFAFHRDHVHKSKGDIARLIKLALEFQSVGAASGKRNTRLIYKDVPVLQGALELAEKQVIAEEIVGL